MISRAPLLERSFVLQPSALWWCGCSHKAVSHSLTSLLSFISALGLIYFWTSRPACFKSIYHHGDGECESCSGASYSLPSIVDTVPSALVLSQQANVCQINHSLQQRNRQPWNWTSFALSKQVGRHQLWYHGLDEHEHCVIQSRLVLHCAITPIHVNGWTVWCLLTHWDKNVTTVFPL